MKRILICGLLAGLMSAAAGAQGPPLIPAQPYKPGIPERTATDSAITNVRIVFGNGTVIQNGHIIIRGGSGQAQGTTALRDKSDSGQINGPRIIPSGAVNLRQTPAEARAQVQALAAMGIRHTGEINLTPEPAPPQAEVETLRAIVEEAAKFGMQVNVHAVSSAAMVAAIDLGVRRLVHLPNKDFTSYEQAEKVASTGSIVAGLIAFGAPTIERESPPPAGCPQPCQGSVVFPRDNSPRFRDGRPWPDAIIGPNRDATGRATGTEGGFTIITSSNRSASCSR